MAFVLRGRGLAHNLPLLVVILGHDTSSRNDLDRPTDLVLGERVALCLLLGSLVALGMFPNVLVPSPPRSLAAAHGSATPHGARLAGM